MTKILQAFKAYLFFTVLLGLVYPLAITLIAQTLLPYQANGSLLYRGKTVIGSKLIGQDFTDSGYFQSRPSANNYDAANSGATNLGPSSRKLMYITAERITKIRQENALNAGNSVPADMALSSASGLDPHISIENALIQSQRIAKKRGIPIGELKKMILNNTDPDFIGIWGQAGVNILALNIELDEPAKHIDQNVK